MITASNTQELIQTVEQATSAEALFQAVRTLAATGDEAAIPTLITVLGYNNPGAAVAAVDGLVQFAQKAVPHLLTKLDGYDYGARAWAIRALSKIGDPQALDTLLEAAASDFALSVRRAAAKGLGSIQWDLLPDAEVQEAQQKTLKTLLQVSNDPEWVVRYAAIVGLQGLGEIIDQSQSGWMEQISAQLQKIQDNDEEITLRARAQLAQGQLTRIVEPDRAIA
ncbi:MAG: HEAT repeat domain-containing protein [Halothece sp.]